MIHPSLPAKMQNRSAGRDQRARAYSSCQPLPEPGMEHKTEQSFPGHARPEDAGHANAVFLRAQETRGRSLASRMSTSPGPRCPAWP